jgi:lysyl-tRNA synthetase class 2
VVSGALSCLTALSEPLADAASAPDVLTDVVFATSWPSLGYGAAMLLVARSLARRKRAAWWAALVTAVASLLLGVASDLLDGFWAPAELAVQALLAVALLLARPEFTVLPDPVDVRRAVRGGLAGAALLLLAGAVLVGVCDTASGSALERLWYAGAGMLVSVDSYVVFPSGVVVPTWVDVLLNVAGTLAVLTTAFLLFRPPADPSALGAAEDDLRALLARGECGDSLGYFNLRRDKTAVFAPNGRAAVVHRVIGGVSVASADPVGNPQSWPAAIGAWQEQLGRHGWIPAVVGASETGATAYHRAGLQALEVGDEAVLDVADFSLEGRSVRGVRQAVNRLQRSGSVVAVRWQSHLGPGELAEVVDAAERWREGAERGFSMALGRIGDPADPDLLVATCRDAQGALTAVLTFVPWGSDGVSLDLMRRDPAAANGTVELTVTRVVAFAAEHGLERISLNFAVFRSVFERGSRLGAGPVLRLWYRTLLLLSRSWQLEQLYRANAKYQPRWVPRFVCFDRTADLPRIGVAVARAEQFLPQRKGPAKR